MGLLLFGLVSPTSARTRDFTTTPPVRAARMDLGGLGLPTCQLERVISGANVRYVSSGV